MSLREWFSKLVTGTPHEKITRFIDHTGRAETYLIRWHLVPKNRWCNVYLHKFIRNDSDDPHCHPWDSISFLIRGRIRERAFDIYAFEHEAQSTREIHAPALTYRGGEFAHSLELIDGKPAWSIFITGPKWRDWGFWTRHGFIPWTGYRDYYTRHGAEQ